MNDIEKIVSRWKKLVPWRGSSCRHTNADAAETNHLQTCRASETGECSWNRRKRQASRTIESLVQGPHGNLKIEHVNSIFGGSSATARRWQVNRPLWKMLGVLQGCSESQGCERQNVMGSLRRVVHEVMRLEENYMARFFRNDFVTVVSNGWKHPDLTLEAFKCCVPLRKEIRDLSLLGVV